MTKKKNNGPTVKELIELAKDLNKLMGLDPALPTAQKTTKDKLTEEIKKVTKMLEPGDKLTKESIATLKVLGFEMPKPPESKPEEKSSKKEEKEKTSKPKKTGISERKAFLVPLIEKGKFTRAQLIDKAIDKFPETTKSAVGTLLSDGKNPKYNSFDKLVVQTDDGILSFK